MQYDGQAESPDQFADEMGLFRSRTMLLSYQMGLREKYQRGTLVLWLTRWVLGAGEGAEKPLRNVPSVSPVSYVPYSMYTYT